MASNLRQSIPPCNSSSSINTPPVSSSVITSANKNPSSPGMTMTSPSSTSSAAAATSSASTTSGSKTSPSPSYFDCIENNSIKAKLKYHSESTNVSSSGSEPNKTHLFKSSLINSPSELCSSNFNNIGENKPLIKNKMPSSSGLFSGLGVKNPMSSLGSSIGKTFTMGNITGNSGCSGSSNNNTPVSLGGLPPIPPGSIINNASQQGSSCSNTNPKENNSHHPSKPARASLPIGAKTRLKSPSRNKPPITSMTLEDLANHSSPRGNGSSKSLSGKKKQLGAKRYASSLPDQERNNACSPVAFDLNSFLCNQGPIDFSALLAGHTISSKHQNTQQCSAGSSFRGHAKPTKHCKNKHLWARTSLEKDLFTPSSSNSMGGVGGPSACSEGKRRGGGGGGHHHSHSGEHNGPSSRQTMINPPCNRNGATSPPITNNRHSSYHPNYGGVGLVSDTAAAAAAVAAAAYNAHMFFSRPTSPLFMDSASASCCPAVGDFSNFCPSCAVKTFPRARSSAHHGLCHCCHQQSPSVAASNHAPSGSGVGAAGLGAGVSNSNLLGVS